MMRIPPPQATTLIEQWIIDALLHLDQCVDESKRVQKESMGKVDESLRDMNAALTASITAGKDGDKTLSQLIAEHLKFHQLMDNSETARKSVWKGQGAAITNLVRILTDLIGLMGGVLILKALGVHL